MADGSIAGFMIVFIVFLGGAASSLGVEEA